MRIRYLSYIMQKTIPTYADIKSRILIVPGKNIKSGDSCNTYNLTFNNHWGTHIDAPAHFFNNAKTISNYDADYWYFKHPCVINIPAEKGYIIKLNDFNKKINRNNDIILIKTGFHRLRGSEEYSFDNPVIHPQIALWLREKHPNIKAIGFDFISVSSYNNRLIGRETHRAFLNPKGKGNPILIIEDMKLSDNLSKLKSIYVVPLLIKGVDSAPCTALGLFN